MYLWELDPDGDFKIAACKNYFKAVYLAVDEFIDSCETREFPSSPLAYNPSNPVIEVPYYQHYPQHIVVSTDTAPVNSDNYQVRYSTNVEYFI